jgi:hypothetical protein
MASGEVVFDIPEQCWAGVAVRSIKTPILLPWPRLTFIQKNEGPNFYIEVEKVPVPEIGISRFISVFHDFC